MEVQVVKKQRKENWSREEVVALKTGYIEQHEVLESKFSSTVTQKAKESAWLCVLESINCQSVCQRNVVEIKKKWSDIKTALKKKERERRLMASKTGGGPAPAKLDSLDEKVLQLIGEVAVGGLMGVDTFQENLTSTSQSAKDKLQSDGEEFTGKKTEASCENTPPTSGITAPLESSSNPEKRKRTSTEPIDKYQELIELEKKKCSILEELVLSNNAQSTQLEKLTAAINKLTDVIIKKNVLDDLITEM